MFSSVSAPFWWPTIMTRRPSIRAGPPTIAPSSPKRRSPWSSTNASVMWPTSSRVCGRRGLRASWTRAHTASRGSAGVGGAAGAASRSRGRPRRRSTTARAPGRRLGRADGAEQGKQQGELVAKVRAGHDPVHEPVAEQELGALEAGRQLLGDRAGGDAGSREADQRIRLGYVYVTERRERGED